MYFLSFSGNMDIQYVINLTNQYQYIVIHSIKMFNRLTALFKTRSAKPTKETPKYRISL